jgi:hypothetical protein
MEFQVQAWDRHKYVAGLNRLRGFSLLIIGSPAAMHIKKRF